MTNELLYNFDCGYNDFDDDCDYVIQNNSRVENRNEKYFDINIPIHFNEIFRQDGLKLGNVVYNLESKYMERNKKIMHDNIKNYFKQVTNNYMNIVMDKHIMNDMPIIKGTRIPITNILACLRDEMTIEEICDSYNLRPDQVDEAMDYVIELIKSTYLEDE